MEGPWELEGICFPRDKELGPTGLVGLQKCPQVSVDYGQGEGAVWTLGARC